MSESKTSRAVLDQIKNSYILGEFNSIASLAEKFGLNRKTLQSRIVRESWLEQREVYLSQIASKLVKKSVNLGEEYLLNTFQRTKRYEKIIDKALDQACDLVDPDQLNQLSLVEARTHAIAKSCLRIADVSSVDVTSKGESIGESLVTALQKLRETDKTPPLTSADCDRILEAEVISEEP